MKGYERFKCPLTQIIFTKDKRPTGMVVDGFMVELDSIALEYLNKRTMCANNKL